MRTKETIKTKKAKKNNEPKSKVTLQDFFLPQNVYLRITYDIKTQKIRKDVKTLITNFIPG